MFNGFASLKNKISRLTKISPKKKALSPKTLNSKPSTPNPPKKLTEKEKEQFRLSSANKCGIHYITERIIAMGFPNFESNKSKLAKTLSSKDSIGNKMALHLNKYHRDKYMIWNLSEKNYDTSGFKNNVIDFTLSGYPVPPLEQLFILLTAIDNWLKMNTSHVAVLHCHNGKGRTVTCISAFLAWSKFNDYSPARCLTHVCQKMKSSVQELTVPSQIRYLGYLTKILVKNEFPKSDKMVIKSITLQGIPVFEKYKSNTDKKLPTFSASQSETSKNKEKVTMISNFFGQNNVLHGCRPYLQIFKNGELIYSSKKKIEELKFYDKSEKKVVWNLDNEIEGDILIRVRHYSINNKNKTNICRYAFHTGFLEKEGTIRFKKTQLDGVMGNNKFPNDFIIKMNVKQKQNIESQIDSKEEKNNSLFLQNMAKHSINKYSQGPKIDLVKELKSEDQTNLNKEQKYDNDNDKNDMNKKKKNKSNKKINIFKIKNPYLNYELLKSIETQFSIKAMREFERKYSYFTYQSNFLKEKSSKEKKEIKVKAVPRTMSTAVNTNVNVNEEEKKQNDKTESKIRHNKSVDNYGSNFDDDITDDFYNKAYMLPSKLIDQENLETSV